MRQKQITDRVAAKHDFDTMLKTTDFCQIGWNEYHGTYKWPRLQELYYKLFGRYFESAHNAANDTRATMECFWKLVQLGEIDLARLL